MAIDDFSFKAFQQAGLPTISSQKIDSIKSRFAIISAYVNDQLSNSSITVKIDTTAAMLTPSFVQDISQQIIAAGSGNVEVFAKAYDLLPAKKYYSQFIVSNQQGTSYSPVYDFFTKPELPIVQTDSLIQISPTSCTVYGSILYTGGDSILEKGICWGIDSLPTINLHLIPNNNIIFNTSIHQLPSGTKLYFRTYCRNSIGIAYGRTISWHTPTSIIRFIRNESAVTNKDTVVYEILFKEKVSGITSDHFQLKANGHTDAAITQLREENTSWFITIKTGSTDATIKPVFMHHESYLPTVLNAPYEANITIIDKTEPLIRSIHFNNRSYKSGDTIHIQVNTFPEKSSLKLLSGYLLDYPLLQFSKNNDSTWKAYCIIKKGGQEIEAEEVITTSIILADEAGNQNNITTFSTIQNNDAIDLTMPAIEKIVVPNKSLFKSADSMFLQLQFTEPILLDSTRGSPVLSVTIGTRIKHSFLHSIINDSSFNFCYIIKSDDLDMDGIRIANAITLNNAVITDRAGNLLSNTIPNAGIFRTIKVDAVEPVVTNVITPQGRTYGLGDTLYFSVFVSEPLAISQTNAAPKLEITADNTIFSTTYILGSNNPLRFYWIVQKGISDKNGLNISPIMLNSEGITDSSGNCLQPILKNVGSLTQVWVDGLAPTFKNSSSVIEVCANGLGQLSGILAIDEAETGETIEWKIFSAPTNGKILGLPINTRWTNNSQVPTSIFYSPELTRAGVDECVIQVSDGVNISYQKIRIQINLPISNNIISASQTICAGYSAEPLQGKSLNGGNGIFSFAWESNNNNTINYQKASGVFDKEWYYPLNVTSSTKFRRIVSSGGCADTSENIFIDVRTKGLWLGHQSNIWNTGGNWCSGVVPDIQTDVYFNPSLHKKTIVINDSSFLRTLVTDSSTFLVLNAPLLFTGSLYGLRNIDALNGTIVSIGKEKQYLSASVFTNKTAARLLVAGLDLDLTDSLFISDYFSIQKGSLTTHNLLFLLSKSISYPNAAGSRLRGSISVYKNFIGRQKERFLHHPFRHAIPVHISNNRIDLPKNNFAVFSSGISLDDSIFKINSYEPASQYGSDFKWQTNPANKHILEAGRGFTLSKPGSPIIPKKTISLFANGETTIGEIEIEFPLRSDSNYILTGNPYLSPINSKHISKSEGIGNYYWVWDTSLAENGAYRAKFFLANNTINSWEGFIAKTLPNKTLSFSYSEQAKLIPPLADSIEGVVENTHQLEIELVKDNLVHDKLLILDVDTARNRFDAADAEKIINPESNFYSLSADTIALSVDARWLTNRTSIPLGIDSKKNGEFGLRFSRIWLKSGIDLELHDLFTGSKIKIDTNKTYRFSITNDSASFGRTRFIIRNPIPPDVQEEALQLQLYPVPAIQTLVVSLQARKRATAIILIKNLLGQVLIKHPMGEQDNFIQQISVSTLLKGNYIVEVHSGTYVIAKAFIKL